MNWISSSKVEGVPKILLALSRRNIAACENRLTYEMKNASHEAKLEYFFAAKVLYAQILAAISSPGNPA